MAEKEDLDLDVKPASGKKKIIILALAGLLLVGGAVGVTLMLLGGGENAEEAAAAEAELPALPETHYLALEKMVVNFQQGGGARFLQVQMELMAHDQAVLEAVTAHMPVIKNDLLLLLSAQSAEQLKTLEGKEALRGEILTVVQRIVSENAALEGPQAVYFTNFVMQ